MLSALSESLGARGSRSWASSARSAPGRPHSGCPPVRPRVAAGVSAPPGARPRLQMRRPSLTPESACPLIDRHPPGLLQPACLCKRMGIIAIFGLCSSAGTLPWLRKRRACRLAPPVAHRSGSAARRRSDLPRAAETRRGQRALLGVLDLHHPGRRRHHPRLYRRVRAAQRASGSRARLQCCSPQLCGAASDDAGLLGQGWSLAQLARMAWACIRLGHTSGMVLHLPPSDPV